MKKFIVALVCSCFLMGASLAFADGNRFGVQFDSDSDFGGIYYGEDFAWAAGFSIGYDEMETTSKIWDYSQDSLSYSLFARKNFKIRDKTYLGLGTIVGWQNGELSGTYDGQTGTVDIDQWNIAPYFILDYHLNENFIINAGATIVNFTFSETTFEDRYITDTDTVEYMEPFLVLTYLF